MANKPQVKGFVTPQSFKFKPKPGAGKENAQNNPTLSELLQMKPDKSFVWVRVPKVEPTTGVDFEPIVFNKGIRFEPGETYQLHPQVAEILQEAIDKQNRKPILQMSGANRLRKMGEAEKAEQSSFEKWVQEQKVTAEA